MLLFATACILRLVFAFTSVSQLGSADALRSLTRDSEHYTQAADTILADVSWTSTGVRIFGPGYPTFLALTGNTTLPAIIVQILIASAGCVLMALLVLRITRNDRIALVSGYLHALSAVATSLSTVLLSDAIFMALCLTGLLVFSKASEEDRVKSAATAGLILGLAVLTRSVGLVLVVVLPLLGILHPHDSDERWTITLRKRSRTIVVAIAAMLLLPSAWIIHNRITYGVSYLGQAGAINMIRSAAAIRQYQDGTPFAETMAKASDSIAVVTKRLDNEHQAFVSVATNEFSRAFSHGPWMSLAVYLATVDDNVNTDVGLVLQLLPDWRESLIGWTQISERFFLRHRMLLLCLVGLWLLYRRREHRVAWLLATTFALFALSAGLSPWQGNRLFYPGQLASAPLMAMSLLAGWDWAMHRRDRSAWYTQKNTGPLARPGG
jgi:4-amino-4-deoxy-L-arabinose transferase-like glycosyltransferase